MGYRRHSFAAKVLHNVDREIRAKFGHIRCRRIRAGAVTASHFFSITAIFLRFSHDFQFRMASESMVMDPRQSTHIAGFPLR